jgi:hypothetical protein
MMNVESSPAVLVEVPVLVPVEVPVEAPVLVVETAVEAVDVADVDVLVDVAVEVVLTQPTVRNINGNTNKRFFLFMFLPPLVSHSHS